MPENLDFNPQKFYDTYKNQLIEFYKKQGHYYPDTQRYDELSDYRIHALMDMESQHPHIDKEFFQHCVDILTKHLRWSPHNIKYAISKSMLQNNECHPFIMQIYEYAAKDVAKGREGLDDDYNYGVVFQNYLEFKDCYLPEGYPESEVFQHPSVQKYIKKAQEYLQDNHYRKQPSEIRRKNLLDRLKNNQELCMITGNFVDIDGTLIQRGEILNEKLYQAMLDSKEDVYIFTGDNDLEKQRKRLQTLGVDLNRFTIISKYWFDENKIIAGTVVDDSNPGVQGLQLLDYQFYREPDKLEDDFAFNHKNEIREKLAKYERGCRAFSVKEKMYTELLETAASADMDLDDLMYGHVPPAGSKALQMLQNMDQEGHNGAQYTELAAKIASGRLLNDRPYNGGWQPTDAQRKRYAIDTLEYLTKNKPEWGRQNKEIYDNLVMLCATNGLCEKTVRILSENNKDWCRENPNYYYKLLYTATFEPQNRVINYIIQRQPEWMNQNPDLFVKIALRSDNSLNLIKDILTHTPSWRENNPKQYLSVLAKAAIDNPFETLKFLKRTDLPWINAHDDIHTALIEKSKDYQNTLNFVENFDKKWIEAHPLEYYSLKFKTGDISSQSDYIKQNPKDFVGLALDAVEVLGGAKVLEDITRNSALWCRENPQEFDNLVEQILEKDPFTRLKEVENENGSTYLTLEVSDRKYHDAYHGIGCNLGVQLDSKSYYHPVRTPDTDAFARAHGIDPEQNTQDDPNKREFSYNYGKVICSSSKILPDGRIMNASIIQDERWIETKPYGGGDHWNWSILAEVKRDLEQDLPDISYQTASYRVRGENPDDDCWQNSEEIKFRFLEDGVELTLWGGKALTVDKIKMDFGKPVSIQELSKQFAPQNDSVLESFKQKNHISDSLTVSDVKNLADSKTY